MPDTADWIALDHDQMHGYHSQWTQGSRLTDNFTNEHDRDYINEWGPEHAIATGHLRLEKLA